MINKSKLALVAVIGFAIASPSFAQTYRTEHQRRLYNYAPGEQLAPSQPDPHAVDNPAMTGGGTQGYNECAGHPRC